MNLRYSGVYIIINIVNNNKYIGSSKNIQNRKYGHFNQLKNNKHYNSHLQKEYDTYGINSFELIGLARCPVEYLKKLEQWFIDTIKPEYNICSKSDSREGLKNSEIQKLAASMAQKGKPKSNATKYKISKTKKGISISDTHRSKLKKLKNSRKRIICNETGMIFNSLKEASEYYGVLYTSISNILTGKSSYLQKHKVSFKYYTKEALLQSL